MRILHCIATMGEGGAERQLVYLAEAQVHRGHEVHVALLRDGPNSHRLRASGAAIHLLRHTGNRDLRIVVRLARLIGAVRPDVVQNWLPQMDVMGGLAATLRRVRWIATERSRGDAYPWSALVRLRVMLVRCARMIVANSEGGAQYWRSVAPRVPVVVIPNAVPVDDLPHVAPAELDGVRRPVILYAGRLNPEKNVATILEAMAREPLRQASLVVCGSGPLRAALEQQARDLGIADRVTFAGFIDPLTPLLKAADVFVSASFFEGRPNAVLEALSCECPVVVSDIPAHREFLNEACARFFDAPGADALAAAVAAVLGDRSGTAARVAEARRVVTMLDAVRVADLYDDVYRRVASAP